MIRNAISNISKMYFTTDFIHRDEDYYLIVFQKCPTFYSMSAKVLHYIIVFDYIKAKTKSIRILKKNKNLNCFLLQCRERFHL